MPDNFERRERPVLPPRPTPPIPNNPNRNINGAPVTPAPSSQSGAMGVHGQRPQNRVQTNNVQNASAHNKMRSGRQPGSYSPYSSVHCQRGRYLASPIP